MFRAGHGLVVCIAALLTLGVVMVNSAGLTIGGERLTSLTDVLYSRSSILAVLAMLALLAGTFVPVQRIFTLEGRESPIPWIIVGSIGLLIAVHLPILGREVNGAKRWIDLGPLGFQPSEIAKWGLPIVLAWMACRNPERLRRFWRGFVPAMLLIGVICLLIGTEDLGTAVLVGAVSVGVLLAAGARPLHIATMVPPAAAAIVGLLFHSPYRLGRIRAFLDPYQDPQGIGYHMLQSMTAVAGGGPAGRGLGNSVQKFGYLPEDTTDFIFAIVCEELGIVGAAVVICLYLGLMICGFVILRRARHPFQQLIALGFTLTVGLQALMNIAVVTGSAPTKGIALPLVSAGGTGWLLTAFSLGLLVAIDREADTHMPQPTTDSEHPPGDAADAVAIAT